MTGEFETAYRQMLKSVVREVADEIVQEQQYKASVIRSSQPDQENRLLLRAREAAKRLAISERHLHKLTVEGVLPCVRVGRLVRYSIDTIEKWIRESESTDALKPRSKRAPTQRNVKPENSVGVKAPSTESRLKRLPAEASSQIRKEKRTRGSATKRRHDEPESADETPNPFRVLLKSIGIERDELGSLTNGELRRVAEVDVPTFHGWMYLGREMPAAALEKIRQHFSNLTSEKH